MVWKLIVTPLAEVCLVLFA